MEMLVLAQHLAEHLHVVLVPDPSRDAAMNPDEGEPGECREDRIQLVQILERVVDPDRGAVRMNQDRQVVAAAEFEHGRESRMVGSGNLLHREVGEVVVAQQELADPTPERILAVDGFDMVDGVSIGGIEAADARGQASLVLVVEHDVLVRDNLVGQAEIVALCIVIEIIMRLACFYAAPFLLYGQTKYNSFGCVGLVHLSDQSLEPVGFLVEVDDMHVHVDDRPPQSVAWHRQILLLDLGAVAQRRPRDRQAGDARVGKETSPCPSAVAWNDKPLARACSGPSAIPISSRWRTVLTT